MRIVIFCCFIIIIMTAAIFASEFEDRTDNSGDRYALGRGAIMISGQGGFNAQWGDRDEINILRKAYFSPSVMYFINQNFAIGGEAVFEKAEIMDIDITGFAVGPNLVVFLGDEDSNDHPFVGCAYHSYYSKTKDYSELTRSGYNLVIGLGMMKMINDHVAITGQGQYTYQQITNKRLIYFPETGESYESKNRRSGSVITIVVGLNFFIF